MADQIKATEAGSTDQTNDGACHLLALKFKCGERHDGKGKQLQAVFVNESTGQTLIFVPSYDSPAKADTHSTWLGEPVERIFPKKLEGFVRKQVITVSVLRKTQPRKCDPE